MMKIEYRFITFSGLQAHEGTCHLSILSRIIQSDNVVNSKPIMRVLQHNDEEENLELHPTARRILWSAD